MTEYTDVPKANALHEESQQVSKALANLAQGGTLYSMVVAPPPLSTEPPPPETPPPPMMMAVTVTIPPPVDPALLSAMTSWLNQRMYDIADELTALGVTVPPMGSDAWTQSVMTSPPSLSTVIPPPPPRPAPMLPPNPNQPNHEERPI